MEFFIYKVPPIDIVLATYNGARFLEQQLSSIQQCIGYSQLVARVIVVDDGSTDSTYHIVSQFQHEDNKIEWHKNPHNGTGLKIVGQQGNINALRIKRAMSNFAYGLTLTSAPYIMLCDQDDVWLENKIQVSFDALQQLVTPEIAKEVDDLKCAPTEQLPTLVFSDKIVTDEKLEPIVHSYFRLKKIPHDWHCKIEQLAQQNVVSGCTMLFNRALLDIAMPIPSSAYMHDWWLALIAARCGKISLIEEPLILYRQHSSNTIGAKKRTLFSLVVRFPRHFKAFQRSVQSVIQQAQAFQQFEQNHQLTINPNITTLARLPSMSIRGRICAVWHGEATRSHWLGRLALLLTVIMLPRNTALSGCQSVQADSDNDQQVIEKPNSYLKRNLFP